MMMMQNVIILIALAYITAEIILMIIFLIYFKQFKSPDQLHHMTTQISPSLLVSQGIPIYQMKHEPRTFLVTFPKAYHAGFNYGFNVAEAANFATCDWLS
jgi:glycopeptide antibiotics resistance protein